ncbi:nuclear transport factor 2 family protein [Nocardia suismassiliense]|uniref:nuclear transport factor 2 family protein n=1 Tax=Nocardia suismassiliense TaxID=2077092 RepID=UPI000D1DD7A4|nr:nuclear transport factor 2 family protein [Nocardia suismassiliense]
MQSNSTTVVGEDALAPQKTLVSDFIRLFYNEKNFDRAAELLRPDFVNHHPGVGVGRQRTVDTFRKEVGDPFPEFTLTIRRMVAEDDHVWTHGLVQLEPDGPVVIVVDIWRIEDGLLAEKWDVHQGVPEGSSVAEMISDWPS